MKYLSTFIRVALLALGQSLDCHSASEVNLMDMVYFSQHSVIKLSITGYHFTDLPIFLSGPISWRLSCQPTHQKIYGRNWPNYKNKHKKKKIAFILLSICFSKTIFTVFNGHDDDYDTIATDNDSGNCGNNNDNSHKNNTRRGVIIIGVIVLISWSSLESQYYFQTAASRIQHKLSHYERIIRCATIHWGINKGLCVMGFQHTIPKGHSLPLWPAADLVGVNHFALRLLPWYWEDS